MNDIKVFNCPKFLVENPEAHEHTLALPYKRGEGEINFISFSESALSIWLLI